MLTFPSFSEHFGRMDPMDKNDNKNPFIWIFVPKIIFFGNIPTSKGKREEATTKVIHTRVNEH